MLTWTKNDGTNYNAEGTGYWIEKGKGRFYLYCNDSERLFTGSLAKCQDEAERLASEESAEQGAEEALDEAVALRQQEAEQAAVNLLEWNPATDDRDETPPAPVGNPCPTVDLEATGFPDSRAECVRGTPGEEREYTYQTEVRDNHGNVIRRPGDVCQQIRDHNGYWREKLPFESQSPRPAHTVMPSANRNTTEPKPKLIGRLGAIGIPVYTDGEQLCVGNNEEFQTPGELYAEVGKSLARKLRKMAREAGYANLASQSAVELVA